MSQLRLIWAYSYFMSQLRLTWAYLHILYFNDITFNENTKYILHIKD